MKLVILDAYTANPGDLSWDELRSLVDCGVYDRTPPDQVLARARDAELVLTNKTIVDRAVIAALPKLRYVGVLATGYNIVDVELSRLRVSVQTLSWESASWSSLTVGLSVVTTSSRFS